MTPPSPEPSATPPWLHCGHGTTSEDPVGCRGIHVPGHIACLAHLADADRDAYLAGLTPGTDIDHSGTTFTQPLLDALLDALRDPATGNPRLGDARFDRATFQGDARFDRATFQGDARFDRATFQGHAGFDFATFKRDARFESATFQSHAWFELATFQSHASFDSATFQGVTGFRSATFESRPFKWVGFRSATFQSHASFELATFQSHASFQSAIFQEDVWFESATFERDARFEQAVFERSVSLGPLVCAGRVTLSGAVFSGPVTLSFAARRLECRRTRWLSTAVLHLRYATVDFAHAVFEYPLTIAAEADPFILPDGQSEAEQAFAGAPDARVRMASLRGVDAAHLVLADVDLSRCLFTGTVHLDQIRLEGACLFDEAPARTHWPAWRPVRFTQRRTLAEEHHWRANQPTAVRGWNTAVFDAGHVGPTQLAPVYRALRKAFEDGKNEPGAADFYYGEMEMRRHDRTGTSRAERGLLHGYWMLSGYGLRASRALGWLAAAMLLTIGLLMGFGLPQDPPKQEATGTVPPGGGKVTFEIDKADPRNPTGNRYTGERFEKALNVTLNSVVFRSSGQDLTTVGTYIEMASRVAEPVLLGLAVLAVRNRVKR
ncbi:pentapeptide repeat-containing protein [Streptomyces samsunensis]|uniref:pentapeptide repeat-containing protein n=1 Tax=Streptomyces malaysiensis TaxID=92644 RepID=UPI0015827728|nr:pentapeptide repeat-containing protein [Streptomyces samsunensis]NUH42867.1 pentapeptide repeat-containing protein [Streptomyces samsunensis]